MIPIIEKKNLIRRTHLLINRRFQLRYMGCFVGAALCAALIIGGVLFYIVEVNWVVQLEKGLTLFDETKNLLHEQRSLVFGIFGGVFLVLGSLLSLWGLYLSHRIAGPVYALSRRMQQIVSQLDLKTPLQFRKKDALLDVKDFFNSILFVIQNQLASEMNIWSALQQRLQEVALRYSESELSFSDIRNSLEILKKDKEQWIITKEN